MHAIPGHDYRIMGKHTGHYFLRPLFSTDITKLIANSEKLLKYEVS